MNDFFVLTFNFKFILVDFMMHFSLGHKIIIILFIIFLMIEYYINFLIQSYSVLV